VLGLADNFRNLGTVETALMNLHKKFLGKYLGNLRCTSGLSILATMSPGGDNVAR